MPAGLSGSGYLGIGLESTKGTYAAPTVWIPILSESLKYTEERYFSPQIRQQTIVSDVKQGYFHVEGDIELEADPAFLPYLLHCSRHTIVKSGAGPYEYKYTPSTAGSSSTAASGNVARTATFLIARNGVFFSYSGCVLAGFSFAVDTSDGVLKMTCNVLGEKEASQAGPFTPTWSAPNLFGAASHAVYVAASAASPTFAAASTDFNGFTFTADYAAEPQNRIIATRNAAYISYGETTANMETELDFIDRTEYDNFVATTQKAYKLESANGGATYSAGTSGVKVQINRAVYETYDLGLSGLGDLIMAGVTARAIGIASGDPYEVWVKSAANIA
jgi:hypothetical protein